MAYSLVIIWALLGIAIMQGGNQMVATLAGSGAVIVAVAAVIALLISRPKRQ